MSAAVANRVGQGWPIAALGAAVCAGLGVLAGIDPWLAIAGSLGVAFVVLAIADLTAGVVVFTVAIALEYAPFAPEGALSLTKAAGVLLVVSWLALVTTRSAARPTFLGEHPGATMLLIAFLAWALLSAIWADDPGAALADITRYAPNFFLLLIVFTAVRSRGQAAWVIGGLIAAAVVAAAFGLVVPPDPSEDPTRLEGAAGNANVTAAVSIAGMALALGGALALRGKGLARIALVAAAAICLAAALLTGSRSGVITLAAVLLAAILVGGRWRGGALGAGVVVAAAAAAFVAFYAPPEVRERITQTTPGQVQEEGRVTLWQVGWRMVEDEPLRGIGVGNFAGSAIDYVQEPGLLTRTDQVIDDPKVAHNIYLHILAELGVIGLALFGAILGFCVGCAYRAAVRFRAVGDRAMEVISRAVVIAMLAILVSDFFASEQFSKLLWILLGLGPALEALARRRRDELSGSARPA
jgi:O-antigen ligase